MPQGLFENTLKLRTRIRAGILFPSPIKNNTSSDSESGLVCEPSSVSESFSEKNATLYDGIKVMFLWQLGIVYGI